MFCYHHVLTLPGLKDVSPGVRSPRFPCVASLLLSAFRKGCCYAVQAMGIRRMGVLNCVTYGKGCCQDMFWSLFLCF